MFRASLSKVRIIRSLLWLLFILFYACSPVSKSAEHSIFSFEKKDSIVLETGYPNVPWAATSLQHITFRGNDYIYATDIDNKKILRIDLNTKTIDQDIYLKFLENDRYPVFNIQVFNENNILILRDVTNFRSSSDSAFYLVDSLGKVKTRFLNYPESFINNKAAITPYSLTLKHAFLPFFCYADKVFFRPQTYYGTITNSQRDSARLPEIIRFDSLSHGSLSYSISPLKNPNLLSGLYSRNQRNAYLLPLSDEELIIGYNNNSTLYKINFSTGELLDSTIQHISMLISDPNPLKSPDDDRSGNNRQSTNYTSLINDSSNARIIRFANLGAKNDLTAGEFQDFLKNQWFGVFDEDLNFVGQGLKPLWFTASWPRPICTNGLWYSIKTNPTDNFKLTIYISKLVKTSLEYDKLESTMDSISNIESNRSLVDYPYLEKIPDGTLILLVPESSCPACINAITSYYVEHLPEMENKKVYFLTNSSQAQNLLAENRSDYVFVDSKRNLQNYLNSSVSNPMLFYWKDKKVKQSIILNPNEARNFEVYLNRMLTYREQFNSVAP